MFRAENRLFQICRPFCPPISSLSRRHLRSLASIPFCHLHHPPKRSSPLAFSPGLLCFRFRGTRWIPFWSPSPGGDVRSRLDSSLIPSYPCTPPAWQGTHGEPSPTTPRSPVLEPPSLRLAPAYVSVEDNPHTWSPHPLDVTTNQTRPPLPCTPCRSAGRVAQTTADNLRPRVSLKGCIERNALTSTVSLPQPPDLPEAVRSAAENHPMMTASPPTRPTPPPAQRDEPQGPVSKHTAQHSMQSSVPARPKSSSHTMQHTEPRPAAEAVDLDHASRHDEYEVVEAEDGEAAGPEGIPRSSSVRPPLPRLNSQSRAPPSPAPRPETFPPQPPPRRSSSAGTPQPQRGGPLHLQGSREIPIPMRKSSTQNQGAHTAPTPSATETAGSRTDGATQDAKSAAPEENSKSQAKQVPQEKNAPIQIPKVTPLDSGLTLPPNLAELAQGLEGKYVDEFGNILDWNGQVLGRVEGDLPSMIGRPVSPTGEIFSEDGEVVGYVAENDTIPPTPPSPRPIEGMGDGLKVDHMGNILDKNNNVVGHFDGAPLAKSLQQTGQTGSSGQSSGARPGRVPDTRTNCSQCNASQPKPSATTPSPSEIFMDVKSTNDGIQLIIKIPTVFNGGGMNPNIHIGTGH